MKKHLLLVLGLFALGNVATVSADSDVITLDLSKPTVPATMEYTAEGYWKNTYNDVDYPYLIFSPFKFSHVHDGNGWGGMSWDGFTVSKNAATTKPSDYNDQWGCIAGGGIKVDQLGQIVLDADTVVVDREVPYLVGYWSSYMDGNGSHYMTVSFNDDYLYEPVGLYVANHPQPYYHNKDNGGISKADDYFKLIIGGVKADRNDAPTTVDHYLAQVVEDKLVQPTRWQWVDLSSLGEVKELYFAMESTDWGDWGINTPTYFCMDKLQVRRGNPSNISQPGKENIKVYPTLFSDCVNVESEKGIGQIQLCDLNGRVVYSAFTTEEQYTIPTEVLTQGIYVLKLMDEGSISVHKIIKK